MLDYDTICNDIFPNSAQAKSIVSSTLNGYTEMCDYSYNIEKAKEEIAQSKYADNLADYPVEVCWVSETPDREKLALLIQAAAQEVGMTVDVVQTPWTSVVENSSAVDTTPNVTTTLFGSRLFRSRFCIYISGKTEKLEHGRTAAGSTIRTGCDDR